MAKRIDPDLPARDGYTHAETRIITDVFGFVHDKDPDGRIQAALEAWLGVDVNIQVLSAMIEGGTVEAEIHLGEAKVYLKLNSLEDGSGDWIEKYDVESVKTAAPEHVLEEIALRLRSVVPGFESVVAAAPVGPKTEATAVSTLLTKPSWNVVCQVQEKLVSGKLDENGWQAGPVSESACKRLASQLISKEGRALAQQMGPEAEMELFAKAKRRKSSALCRRELPAVEGADKALSFVAPGIFADLSMVVTFHKNAEVQVDVES